MDTPTPTSQLPQPARSTSTVRAKTWAHLNSLCRSHGFFMFFLYPVSSFPFISIWYGKEKAVLKWEDQWIIIDLILRTLGLGGAVTPSLTVCPPETWRSHRKHHSSKTKPKRKQASACFGLFPCPPGSEVLSENQDLRPRKTMCFTQTYF